MQQAGSAKTLSFPLEKLEKCDLCSGTSALRLCSGCGERVYCSKECQVKDWSNHKMTCSKTERVDLAMFYPILACMADVGHLHLTKPSHPAHSQEVVIDPCTVVDIPGGPANLVVLGKPLPDEGFTLSKWWPSGENDEVRQRLFQRIAREGYVVSIVVAVAMGLLATMYTTTAVPASASPDGKEKRRIRLRYRSAVVSDFGIAKGSARVLDQDRLAYLNLFDGTYSRGQDPTNHYWIYFRTIKGEEIILDLGMYTFNFSLLVRMEPYIPSMWPKNSFAPVLFRDREIAQNSPELHEERERFSILRNTALQAAVSDMDYDNYTMEARGVIWEFMETVAGRTCTDIEKGFMADLLRASLVVVADVVKFRSWTEWPEQPHLQVGRVPGELDHLDEESHAWRKELKKWKKAHKGYTSEDLRNAFSQWKQKYRASHGYS